MHSLCSVLADANTDITEDILVLVEPGTPVGSANCREARAMLLGIGNNDEELGWELALAISVAVRLGRSLWDRKDVFVSLRL